jgi:resuscitation-promoting factor RpfA
MAKSPEAFRTIGEVSDWLETPPHVLRFWESRFPEVKPVKRAGGRRYYRPADVELLGGIKKLLHDDGVTIRGVQKILQEKGVRHVAALSPPAADNGLDAPTGDATLPLPEPAPPAAPDTPLPAPPTPARATRDPGAERAALRRALHRLEALRDRMARESARG